MSFAWRRKNNVNLMDAVARQNVAGLYIDIGGRASHHIQAQQ
jgi:hypothetical protein